MEGARIIKLDIDTEILPFDCGDADLNGFLFDDAKNHCKELVATTFLMINNQQTIAYWSYLNDKITVANLGNSETFYERIISRFSKEIKAKEYKSFPAVKIGRLAVDKKHKGKGIGKQILEHTKQVFVTNNRTGCRFLTVDAFKEATPFYEQNDFIYFSGKDKKSDTRQMFYDLNRETY